MKNLLPLLILATFWHAAKRNKSDDLLKALGESGSMLGLSLYPHHLKNNTNCTLKAFVR